MILGHAKEHDQFRRRRWCRAGRVRNAHRNIARFNKPFREQRSHVALGFARALADVNYDTSELRSSCGGHGCQQQRADGKKNSTRAPLAEPTGEVAVRGRFHLPMIINPARFGRQ